MAEYILCGKDGLKTRNLMKPVFDEVKIYE